MNILKTAILSFIFIILSHNLYLFFKNNLTVPKVKDLVTTTDEKYNDMFNVINTQNETINNITNEGDNMKNELKEYNYSDLAMQHTAHLTTSEKYGNVVTLTQTLGPNMGSRVATKGLGFLYNVTFLIFMFGFVFAINSSIHSFLILNYTNNKRVTLDVGFYYMSNAFGRLIGTLLSGLAFQYGGFTMCLFITSILLILNRLSIEKLNLKNVET